MTVRELSHAQRVVMDLLVRHPDWTNDEIGYAAGYHAKYVGQLLTGAYRVLGVSSRTGAVMAHARRRGPAVKRRDTVTEGMGL